MWESQEIKEIGFPKGQSSVLVCTEDEKRDWGGGNSVSEATPCSQLTAEASANSSRESQAGFGRQRGRRPYHGETSRAEGAL